MADFEVLARSIFEGCSACVGPMIGVDLEIGPTSTRGTDALPGAELAVLPQVLELGDQPLGQVELASPLYELAPLARRMLGEEDPDSKTELSPEALDAMAEILGLMGGAVEQAIRQHVNAEVSGRALEWWRTDAPSGHALAEGERLLAEGSLALPTGEVASVFFRMPAELLERGASAEAPHSKRSFLLLCMDDALAGPLETALTGARLEVARTDLEDEEASAACARAAAIFLPGGRDDSLDIARRLRLANETWRTPIILCASEPTRDDVIAAMHAGASGVLVIPAGEEDVLRAIQDARP